MTQLLRRRIEPSQVAPYTACLAAITAALVIPGHHLGVNIVVVAVFGGSAVLLGRERPIDAFDLSLWAAGFLLIVAFMFRTAEWVLALDLLGAVVLAMLGTTGRATWLGFVDSAANALGHLPKGASYSLRPLAAPLRAVPIERSRPIARGVAYGLGLLVVFGSLFLSADRAFASLVRDAIFFEFDLALISARVIVGVLVAAGTGSLIVLSRPGAFRTVAGALFARPERSRLDPVEWIPGVVLLDVLFLTFVAVQVAVLFGGRSHVLETEGLTYAEYARQGFFQLVAVVALTFLVIAAIVHFADLSTPRMQRLARAALGALCTLTFVVLLSAYVRLDLYEETYGFTRLRLFVHAAIVWFAVLLALVFVAGLRWEASWLPRAVVVLTTVVLLAFNAIDPDRFIARRNIELMELSGEVDPHYLAQLSLDAVPALADLPEPLRSCLLTPRRARLDEPQSIWSFNFSRSRAHRVLATVSPEGCHP